MAPWLGGRDRDAEGVVVEGAFLEVGTERERPEPACGTTESRKGLSTGCRGESDALEPVEAVPAEDDVGDGRDPEVPGLAAKSTFEVKHERARALLCQTTPWVEPPIVKEVSALTNVGTAAM
jgi:hypothetical protein